MLVEGCYRFTRDFPKDEMYGLTSQIRRASVSVPANVAEGYGRDSTGFYVHFPKNAQGSLKELETHLVLSQRLELANPKVADLLLTQAGAIGRMLRALTRSVQNSSER